MSDALTDGPESKTSGTSLEALLWVPGIAERVAGFLAPNEVACNLRHACRAAGSSLRRRSHTTVRLSRHVPQHAFASRWGAPGALDSLTLQQRCDLISLTAASGTIPNLELVLSASGIVPPPIQAWTSASRAGHLHVCRYLCECTGTGALESCADALIAAAAAGHEHMCEWLLGNGCPWTGDAVAAAAGAGHLRLMGWLLGRRPPDHAQARGLTGVGLLYGVLTAVTMGCDLATLQRAHRALLEEGAEEEVGQEGEGEGEDRAAAARAPAVMAAEAGPPLPPAPQEEQQQEEAVGYDGARGAAAASQYTGTLQGRLLLPTLSDGGGSAPPGGGAAAAAGAAASPLPPAAQRSPGGNPDLDPEPDVWRGLRKRILQHGPESPSAAAAGPEMRAALLQSRAFILSWAAGSSTPDWAAKVEWLEARGYPRTARACRNAAGVAERGPDGADGAAARLAWLRRRDYPVCGDAVTAAAGRGDLRALAFLLAEAGGSGRLGGGGAAAARAAAAGGHLAALRALRDAGCALERPALLRLAAGHGHLGVVEWLMEGDGAGAAGSGGGDSGGGYGGGGAPPTSAELLYSVALSGNAELLACLRERGCPWDAGAFTAAAHAGSVAALEWLAERGCPMPTDGCALLYAAREGDLLTLRCLARLGCPWGHPGALVTSCVRAGVGAAALRCLLQLGCPVVWEHAAAVADAAVVTTVARGGGSTAVAAAAALGRLLEEERSRRQDHEQRGRQGR
ncbi:hypothetical protein GPECTOR_11g22 [Gonium pectorale]|uniref:Uncharacterized protein n=1 Tax=Gonium pectorale TaxID=33097 RepID=A0A150GPI5_GONPE|nr:hypothetical protein GPECTOR_11g22 [Gonium pectorale]|eukprot:KXZ51776.1 hypothetical protein GPECTOR_11g22 [Gonium pectorale]